jgi:hypothetical protein
MIIEHKSVKEYKIKRKFKKNESVFKDYLEDNAINLKKSF